MNGVTCVDGMTTFIACVQWVSYDGDVFKIKLMLMIALIILALTMVVV